jgi:hypothetical protein
MPSTFLRGAVVLTLSTALPQAAGQRPEPAEHHSSAHDEIAPVARQPLGQHARRVATALEYLGQPLAPAHIRLLEESASEGDDGRAIALVEEALAPYVLLDVAINPESRVSVRQGAAPPVLMEAGSRLFLIRVRNQAGVTAPLRVSSPNAGRVSISSWTSDNAAEPAMRLTERDVAERWAELTIFDKPPMAPRLSGLGLEYLILDVYSRDRGQRAAEIAVDVGQGSQDVGFRNDVSILFTAKPAEDVRFRVRDERGRPAMAAFVIRDEQGRVYPLGSKRLAPDFPFQPQIYRGDDEDLPLPAGRFEVTYSAGPEYVEGRLALDVREGGSSTIAVDLRRWIDPSRFGWYSGDHHIHAAGCSHYENPTQGVGPDAMMRQVRGEALNVGSVLTWGPCYYHQKQFFTGEDHALSTGERLLHYDLEVSGFPSSHAGHLVLLGLQDQDYRGATRLEGWPSWGLPILKWARAQGAVTGFAHSGWGLAVKSTSLPNHDLPPFDGIGANEFIVDVTHEGAVDFISAVNTPYPWELNIWYHTLNVGFRTRLSGETDFPCITDERVGAGRTYAKLDRLTYRNWLDAIRAGRTYVSDGRTHLMDFAVNGMEAGTGTGELTMARGATARVTLKAAALLDDEPPSEPVAERRVDEKPYWSIERARVGRTRDISLEIVVNGQAIARKAVAADGVARDLAFDVPLQASSWIAARVLGAAHTNPIFVTVDGRPIRASRRSAEWCLAAVDQCWLQKAPQIRPEERDEAARAYDHAREVYRRLVRESAQP